jgi:glycosyltransferase involved in cell wall biosynthesis
VTVHLITGEFPPQFGGVSDYTLAVATGLAKQHSPVHVWCPDVPEERTVAPAGVTVHRSAGSWGGRDLARLDRELDQTDAPRRLIVQWVPHAYGRKSLNVRFCAWIRRRARTGDIVDVMVHEAFFAFGEGGIRQDAAAAVHRLMVSLLLSHARRVWVSIPAWADRLRPFCFGRTVDFEWLPVPSNVATVTDDAAVRGCRSQFTGVESVVGHFGTYEPHVRRALTLLVPDLLSSSPRIGVLFMGRDSDRFRAELAARHPEFADRLVGTGARSPHDLSVALQACDLVVQPYPDGASSRRGTLMAALSHALPVVTTEGRLSESIWRASGAVRLVAAGDDGALAAAVLDLAANSGERQRLGAAGRALYRERFEIAKTIAALGAEPPFVAPGSIRTSPAA